MKKLVILLVLLFAVSFVSAGEHDFSVSDLSENDIMKLMKAYNQNSQQLPDFVNELIGNEIMRVTFTYEGQEETFGVVMKHGMIEKFLGFVEPTATESGGKQFTASLNIDQSAIERVSASDDPLNALKSEWGKGIKFAGIDFFSTIKFNLLDALTRFVFLFI